MSSLSNDVKRNSSQLEIAKLEFCERGKMLEPEKILQATTVRGELELLMKWKEEEISLSYKAVSDAADLAKTKKIRLRLWAEHFSKPEKERNKILTRIFHKEFQFFEKCLLIPTKRSSFRKNIHQVWHS